MSETAEFIESFKEDLTSAFSHLKVEYNAVRAGRANPHVLDKVLVDYYGTMTPINQMANITVPEARLLAINLWDVSQIKNVTKAIIASDIGITPSDDGKTIRLVFPSLTEERRREIVKNVKKLCEDSKIVMRNARRDVLDIFKQMKKDSSITEDDYSDLEKQVQKLVDEYVSSAEKLCEEKEKEIMEI